MNINIDIYLFITLLHFVDESYRQREFKWIILAHPDSIQWREIFKPRLFVFNFSISTFVHHYILSFSWVLLT